MLAINISFFVLLVASCGYAVCYGGWEGKTLCGMLLCASFATPAALAAFKAIYGLPMATFVVDLPLLIGMGLIALRTDRYWPLWIFSFHLLSVLTFAAWLLAPQDRVVVFEDAAAFWSIAIQIILFIGPYLDRRNSKISGGKRDERPNGSADPA